MTDARSKARSLRAGGATYQEIAAALRIGRGAARRLVLSKTCRRGHDLETPGGSWLNASGARLCAVCQPHPADGLSVGARYGRKVKLEALEAYGGAVCVDCGYDRLEALTLHHSDGDGDEHRRDVAGGRGRVFGTDWYARLRARGFPRDRRLEVLCANCHILRHTYNDRMR